MKGRPGWHIECSAMAKATLCDDDYGNTIDIHCGGVDLKFPHHENEKAQSCCSNGTEKFANFWVHNEFLNMGSEKMSKSLGNVTLIHDLLKKWDGEVIRLALLKAHYRSELQWSEKLLRESKRNLDTLYRSVAAFPEESQSGEVNETIAKILFSDLDSLEFISAILEGNEQFGREYSSAATKEILDDRAAWVEEKEPEFYYAESLWLLGSIVSTANLLGLLQKDPEEWFRGNPSDDEEDEINDLIHQRDAAKTAAMAAKKTGDKALMGEQFKRSDEIRDKLKARGIVLEDGPDGTTWRWE